MATKGRTAVESVLQRQQQLVTPAQAKREGAHGSTIARLVDDGELEFVVPRVYGRAGVELTWNRRLLATVLSAGPPARASHRAVARLLGVPSYEAAPLEITIPSKRHFTQPGVIVHQSRDLPYVSPMYLEGIPCTPPRRLAVDIGAVLGEVAYTTVLRELRRSHGVTWKQLAAILDLHSKRGRDGCGPLRRQLERYYGVDGIPDTTLEQQFLDDVIDARFPRPVCQHPVPGPGGVTYRIDFAYLAVLLAIEIDGPTHALPEVKAKDRRRDAFLRSLGWEVLRFREERVLYAPGGVLIEVRRALEARGGWPAGR